MQKSKNIKPMKSKYLLLTLLSMVFALGFTACEQEETPIPSLIMEYPESMTIPAEGGSLWIDVKYNKEEIDLSCVYEQGFCKASFGGVVQYPDEDLCRTNFIIEAYPNKTGKPRSCEVTYKNKKYDNTLVTFSVYQLAE